MTMVAGKIALRCCSDVPISTSTTVGHSKVAPEMLANPSDEIVGSVSVALADHLVVMPALWLRQPQALLHDPH